VETLPSPNAPKAGDACRQEWRGPAGPGNREPAFVRCNGKLTQGMPPVLVCDTCGTDYTPGRPPRQPPGFGGPRGLPVQMHELRACPTCGLPFDAVAEHRGCAPEQMHGHFELPESMLGHVPVPATAPCPLCSVIVQGATIGDGFVPRRGSRHFPDCPNYQRAERSSREGLTLGELVEVLDAMSAVHDALALGLDQPLNREEMEARLHELATVDNRPRMEQLVRALARLARARETVCRLPVFPGGAS
jgi:hypothetical protein